MASFAEKYMQKFGWSEGKGLGKDLDGTVEHIKVKKKENKDGIGQKGFNWANEWWADSYNSACGGKKKKKKTKTERKSTDAGASSSSSSSDTSQDSDDSDEEADSSTKAAAPVIRTQKDHLFAVGLRHAPDAGKTQGGGFVKGGIVVGETHTEVGGLGFNEDEAEPKRKIRTEETDKHELKKTGGRVGGKADWMTGKLKRLEMVDKVLKDGGVEAAKKKMISMAEGEGGPRRSPRLQALSAPSAPADSGEQGEKIAVKKMMVRLLKNAGRGMKTLKLRKQVVTEGCENAMKKKAIRTAYENILSETEVFEVQDDVVTLKSKKDKSGSQDKKKKKKKDENSTDVKTASKEKKPKDGKEDNKTSKKRKTEQDDDSESKTKKAKKAKK